MAIGERLKEAREKKGLSQRAVAQELGMSQPAYCQFEKGRKTPCWETAKALAEVLGVSLDYLAGNDK